MTSPITLTSKIPAPAILRGSAPTPVKTTATKPIVLRQIIGDQLRKHRSAQHRTLREVSRVAQVSLGYLSEVERGQKEASSELLAAICRSLDIPMSTLLADVAVEVARRESGFDPNTASLT
ncbi:MAG: XRE family transcriptional regulator [Actinobacteria bacterium]|nr:XRE family transcriptional regulator [Actinomycetota bacterium]